MHAFTALFGVHSFWFYLGWASTSMQIDRTRLNISGPKLLEAIEQYSNGRCNEDNITASNVDEWLV